MAPDWKEMMVNASTNIFKFVNEESVTYFKRFENLKKLRFTIGLSFTNTKNKKPCTI
jgi:hypothetical protein